MKGSVIGNFTPSCPKKRAKELTLAFAEEAFCKFPLSNIGEADLSAKAKRLCEVLQDIRPYTYSRIGLNNDYLDWVTPSIWHATGYLLLNWFLLRTKSHHLENETDQTGTPGNILVYRGQTNPWMIQPSAWRNELFYSVLKQKPLVAFGKFFKAKLPESDPMLSTYDNLLGNIGLQTLAQHHEFPTNCVDFTFNPLVALYFANQPSHGGIDENIPLHNYGVVYQGYYSALHMFCLTSNFKVHVGIPPPEHLTRVYQQSGFLINYGAKTEALDATGGYLYNLETALTKIYFPRTYPEAKEGKELFSEINILKYLNNGVSRQDFSEYNNKKEPWYHSHPFYNDSFTIIKEYCKDKKDKFDENELLVLLENYWMNKQLPFAEDSRVLSSDSHMALEDSVNKALNFIVEATLKLEPSYPLDPYLVAVLYNSNPTFFESIVKVGQTSGKETTVVTTQKIITALNRWNHLVDTDIRLGWLKDMLNSNHEW